MNKLCPLLFCVGLSGCGTEGALEQVSFERECADGDVSCQSGGIDRPIAVGAVLPVDTEAMLTGSATPELTLVAADETVVKPAGDELLGRAPGRTALLAVTADGQVLDLTHVWVSEPTRLALARSDRDSDQTIEAPIELLAGDELYLDVVAFADSQRLSGRLSGEWQATSEAVTLLSDGALGSRRLVARSPGAARIEFRRAEAATTIDVEVLP
ncbi:MAG: hypothetical protein KJO07_22870 [Deltaproteobacteria bacterium]|nr:hypothetical protein [Deltaproteobacteria bacterium]